MRGGRAADPRPALHPRPALPRRPLRDAARGPRRRLRGWRSHPGREPVGAGRTAHSVVTRDPSMRMGTRPRPRARCSTSSPSDSMPRRRRTRRRVTASRRPALRDSPQETPDAAARPVEVLTTLDTPMRRPDGNLVGTYPAPRSGDHARPFPARPGHDRLRRTRPGRDGCTAEDDRDDDNDTNPAQPRSATGSTTTAAASTGSPPPGTPTRRRRLRQPRDHPRRRDTSGFVDNADDCNDNSAEFWPGAAEFCDDPNDYNCDGSVGFETQTATASRPVRTARTMTRPSPPT